MHLRSWTKSHNLTNRKLGYSFAVTIIMLELIRKVMNIIKTQFKVASFSIYRIDGKLYVCFIRPMLFSTTKRN